MNRQRRVPRLVTKVLFNLEVMPQIAVGTVVNSAKVATGAMRNMPDLHTFVAELYRALADGQEPPTSADDGRTVVRVMEQIWERMPEPAHRAPPPAPAARPEPRTPVERTIVADGGIPGRVLVTGAAGYLGRHVASALVRCGADVRALVRDPAGVPRDLERDTEVVTANLVDADSVRAAMRDVDLVVHCAALTTNNVPWSLHEETNIRGTRSVLGAAREAGATRLVHVSSVVVYGLDSPSDTPLTEATPLPTAVDRWAFYQRSKLEAERALTNGAAGAGPEIVVVRPGIIYGPGAEAPLKKGLVQLGSTRLTIGRGTNHLPLTYVDNVVDGILLALLSPAAAGQAYNLVDEPQPEIRTAALQAAAVVGEPTRLLPVSSDRARRGSRDSSSAGASPPMRTRRPGCRAFRSPAPPATFSMTLAKLVANSDGLQRWASMKAYSARSQRTVANPKSRFAIDTPAVPAGASARPDLRRVSPILSAGCGARFHWTA